ncbi:MAG: SH3 domain-containing protein [Pseudomonadota bacterium]
MVFILQLGFVSAVVAEDDFMRVKVVTPFLDVHTGPGRGFPKFYIAERGEWLQVMQRKTDWFLVRLGNGKEGWVHREALQLTVDETGEPINIEDPSLQSFINRRWEASMLFGDFSGASSLSVAINHSFTPNIAVEGMFSQMLGDFSSSYKAHINLVHQAFPEWRVSPFVMVGAGIIHTDPKATLIETDNRDDELLLVGLGVRVYLTRYFVLRSDYRNYVILTDLNEDEEVDEWTLGFSVFFN